MISILGSRGFIGSALAERLHEEKIFPYLHRLVDKVYFFGSPSSDIIFNEDPYYCFRETLDSFMDLVRFCRDNRCKLIYPSSATVYNLNTPYSRCKAALEDIQFGMGGDILGFRIFAGYGPGEKTKDNYSSIVYQFCTLMKNGLSPTIWGDGNQTRDFVYIDDIVSSIVENSDKVGILDIGTGVDTSFNDIVKIINRQLGTSISPVYAEKPSTYIEKTPCKNPLSTFVDIEEGIWRILKSLS